MKINDLNPEAKLWLYQSERKLTPTEMQWLDEQLATFAVEWASHGKNLKAAAQVLNPYFIALAVDLSHANASGCSIDTSVRFIKQLGAELQLDFFKRLKMWKEDKSGELNLIPFSKLGEHPEDFIYNPLVEKVADMDDKFKVRISEYLKANHLA